MRGLLERLERSQLPSARIDPEDDLSGPDVGEAKLVVLQAIKSGHRGHRAVPADVVADRAYSYLRDMKLVTMAVEDLLKAGTIASGQDGELVVSEAKTHRTLEISADDLTRALYGKGVEVVNKGVYQGTKIPWRKVPKNAMLTIQDKGVITVSDKDGGWIADRIAGGTLGRREFKKVLKHLKLDEAYMRNTGHKQAAVQTVTLPETARFRVGRKKRKGPKKHPVPAAIEGGNDPKMEDVIGRLGAHIDEVECRESTKHRI